MVKKLDLGNVHFVNIDKKNRAEVIYGFVAGLKRPKTEGEIYNSERFVELMKEESVDVKNKAESVLFIYTKLGGAAITAQEAARKKAAIGAKKGKTLARTAKASDDDEGESADVVEEAADDDDDE